MKRLLLAAALTAFSAAAQDWTPLFDGKTLKGWKETPFEERGSVEIKDNTVRLNKGRMTGITWQGEFPKSNYEIRFEAVRLDGRDFFASIIFPVKDSHCAWVSGGWDGFTVGLSNVDEYDASENETSTPHPFETGRWYKFHLKVTDDHLLATIDGRTVIDLDITKHKLSLRLDDTDLCAPLGFASYATTGALRNIEYRKISQ